MLTTLSTVFQSGQGTPNPGPPARPSDPSTGDALLTAARELEVTFLAEMLKAAGLGQARSTLGGGAGEEAFSSFLVTEQARAMVAAGGIGLAQSIYESLLQGQQGDAVEGGGNG